MMTITLIAALAVQAPAIQTVWSTRLQTEIQSHLVGESAIYFGTNDSFGALDQATGRKLWAKSVKAPQLGVFVTAGDGLVFVSVGQGNLIAAEAGSGKTVWSIKRTGYGSPITYLNQAIYAEVTQGKLAAITKGGKISWTADLGKSSPSARPIRYGSSIYVGTKSGAIHALDKDSGKQNWRHAERKSAVQALLVSGERLIATFDDGSILGLSLSTGQKMWAVYTNNALFGTPLLKEGRLYAVSASGRFYSIAAETGQELWVKSLSFRQNFGLSQVIGFQDGYLMADRDKVVALDESGVKKWEQPIGFEMFGNQPRMLGQDVLLISSHEFRLVRVKQDQPKAVQG